MLPANPAIVAATGAVAVAENVIGLPSSPADDAISDCAPGEDPSRHVAGRASPAASDTVSPPVTDPLPLPGSNVTATPGTKFPAASVTLTVGRFCTSPPAVAVTLFPETATSFAGAPAPPAA